MTTPRFSVLHVFDIITRLAYLIGFVLIWVRLGMMEKRGNAMMEGARFERQLLANAYGIDLPSMHEPIKSSTT